MREDYGVILEWLSIEEDLDDIGDKGRKVPYGDWTANVGVQVEVESLIDLIPIESGEIVHLAHK